MASHSYWYVYLLESERKTEATYIGCTDHLRRRLQAHNSGNCRSTSALAPWRLVTYVAFDEKERAFAFEKYLKSASGKAFANKRLR